MSILRVRFAPSPTGHIHVGNVRTALFNYLFAKKHNGTFILRIEDTDIVRSNIQNENIIYEDMQWLGLSWDEGPSVGGDFGPYRQTERFDIYKKYIDKMLESGLAYYCFCTKEELDAQREISTEAGKNPIYNGRCKNIPLEDAKKRIERGEKPSIRFSIKKETVHVSDLLKGEIDFPTDTFGDFIIVRPDGVPVYNFVVVIDDALMKITHVIRGDDHLNNTPKQVLIYEALGFELPFFVHIPMILGKDHSKLSKRHGDTSVNEFRTKGYLPEALFNYLSLLGWSHPEEKEILSKDELSSSFSLDRVSKSAAVFDFEKLNWMNGHYIRGKNRDELYNLCLPYLEHKGNYVIEWIKDVVFSVKDKMTLLTDINGLIDVYFNMQNPDEEALKLLNLETSLPVLHAYRQKICNLEILNSELYHNITGEIQNETKAKGKALYMVLRIGITGSRIGPDMDKLACLIPIDEQIRRIDSITNMLRKR